MTEYGGFGLMGGSLVALIGSLVDKGRSGPTLSDKEAFVSVCKRRQLIIDRSGGAVLIDIINISFS